MARGWYSPGELDGVDHPTPRLVDEHYGVRKQWCATWYDPPFMPGAVFVDQVYALCFDAGGSIVLVDCPQPGGSYWNLPGGGLEPNETFEECLIREVREEACAQVTDSAYIGCQRVDEYDDEGFISRSCYQLRLWARVALETWEPEHETVARKLVPPNQFLADLAWGQARTARLILAEGLKIESRKAAGL